MPLIRKIIVALFAILALVTCSWALLHTGMFRIHDYTHAARIAEILRSLQDGEFPARWSANFGYGYGMPLFEFYAPLPFYVGALLYWLGVGLVPAVKLLLFLCSLGTFVGAYLLGSRLFGRSAGLLGAVAVTLAPYRAVNLFVRGDIGEAWAMMAIPWVLLGIVLVVRRAKWAVPVLVTSLVVLFLSHNITTLLFFPLSLLFGAGFLGIEWLRTRRLDFGVILRLALAYALAIGLAAFYLFPALGEKDFTKVNDIFVGYFAYANHFVYIRKYVVPYWGYGGSEQGLNTGLSFFLGYGQLLGAGMFVLLMGRWILQRLQNLRSRAAKNARSISTVMILGLLALEALIALFMSTSKSQFIWDHLSFMTVVQFPWRWITSLATFLGLLIGGTVIFWRQPSRRYLYVIILSIVMAVTTIRYFQPENWDNVADAFYYADPYRIRHDMSRTLNDYIPTQMVTDSLSHELPPIDVPFVVKNGDAKQATLLVNHTNEKLLQTAFTQPATIELAVADFPGWTVLLDNQVASTQRSVLGNIEVTVPAGNHLIAVQLRDTPLRLASDVLSGISVVAVIALLWLAARHQQKRVAI